MNMTIIFGVIAIFVQMLIGNQPFSETIVSMTVSFGVSAIPPIFCFETPTVKTTAACASSCWQQWP